MTCPACGSDSREGARFCDRCGSPLAGPPTPEPRTYTPRHLAERILRQRSALEGERKHVTVLFIDIKSSLELSQQVDVEAWHGILDEFFAILAAGVHRFEGTVNQYTGDGIMALFGAPIAHEDHAQRACSASLFLLGDLRRYADDLRRTRGLNVSVRVGLNSGEVVVGRIGDDLRMDYTAQGPVVGLAQRMEELAEPGKAFLTEHTAALVEGFFDLRDLGEFSLRGVQEAVCVYELAGEGPLRTRLDRSEERGFSRFVGRQDELTRLDLALADAARGRGQVLSVVADAGVGKSRLLHEFTERVRAQGTQVHEARAVSHGHRIPFLPLLELLKSYFAIAAGDSDAEVRRKVAGTLVLLDPEFERSMPLLFEFMGVPDPSREPLALDPDRRRQRLFRLVERVFKATGTQAPCVIAIEDLHWIDSGTQAFLDHMVGAVAHTSLLLLLNYRPEYRAPFSGAHVREVALRPLGPAQAAELVRDWLGSDPGLRELPGFLLERTAGNPFFIEEVVHSLVESGSLLGTRGAYRLAGSVSDLTVPESVHAVLAARIDRLGEPAKQVLQTAAVIGEHVSETVLRRVLELPADDVDAALATLRDRDFLAEISLHPDREFAFKHPLTRAVAYRSQLFHRRADLHREVAEALVELSTTSLDERAALVAHHWEAAGVADDAARWHRRAALWVGLSHPADALHHWRRTEALVRERSDTPEVRRLRLEALSQILNLGWRFGMGEEEAADLYEQGRTLATSLSAPTLVARLSMAYGQLVSWAQASDGHMSIELGRTAVALADETDDAELQAQARGQLARAHWRARDYAASLAATEEGLARAPESNEHLRFRARVLSEMARLDEARADLDHALTVARAHGDVSARTLTHLCFGIYARFIGDFELERVHAQTALDLAERTGDVFGRIQSLLSLGESYLWDRQFAQSLSLLEGALALARERHANLFAEASMLGLLADAYLGQGDAERALQTAEEALAVKGAPSIQALQALARALLAGGSAAGRERAADLLAEADRFIDRSGAESWRPHVLVTHAELAAQTGRADERDAYLRRALEMLRAMGALGHAEQVANQLAD